MALFASELFESAAQVDEIRAALQTLLRQGDVDEAALRLDFAIDALDELGHPVTALCRAATPDSVTISGWEQLVYRLAALDKPGCPITAIGIDISSHGEGTPDDDGAANPYLETSFYTDDAYAFSTATREDLIGTYDTYGADWQGNFADIDGTIGVSGLGALHAAAARLDADCRAGTNTDGADHDAMFIACSLVAVRLHQAVRSMVQDHGLPRPMPVLVGSNESYPFFDAPVVTTPEYRAFFDFDMFEAEPETEVDASADLADGEPYGHAESESDRAESDGVVVLETESTGSALRRALKEKQLEEEAALAVSTAAAPAEKAGGMFSRLIRRKA